VTRTRRRIATALLTGLALAGIRGAAARADTDGCTPWPGEPTPLPTVSSVDPVLARWAILRSVELAAEAQSAEIQAPARANRLWQHARCLDPGNRDAAQGIERTPLFRVYRPDVVVAKTAPAPGATPALAGLDETIRVARRPVFWLRLPPTPADAPPQPSPDWKRIDEGLSSAEAQLRAANFEAALSSVERLRRRLGEQSTAAGARARQARAEVVAATAEIALGREDAARKSFERALAADPALRLDPAATSPKVRRAFDAARGANTGTP
jgi:hypothetical protein